MASEQAIPNRITASQTEDFHTAAVTTISAAHALHDTYTGFLSPLLPVLIERLLLTKTQAGFISICIQIPSLLQPFIGYLADRYNLRLVMILTPAITAALMSLLGVAPLYGVILLLALATGVSSAAFHSVAPVISGKLSGSKLGRGMSFWMVGGEAGRALGPIVIVTALKYLGIVQLPWLMVVGIVISFILYLLLKDVPVHLNLAGTALPWRETLRKMGPVMGILAAMMLVRAMLNACLATYLPTYLTERGSNLWLAGAALTIMEIAGVAGALISGSLSDRLGRRRMLALGVALTPLFMLLLTNLSISLKPLALLAVGFTNLSINPVLMAISQEQFPDNRAFANGMFMLISFGSSALGILAAGLVGDTWGLQAAYTVSAGIMLAGTPLVLLLPKKQAAG